MTESAETFAFSLRIRARPLAQQIARDEFLKAFPTLTGVRDTSHHLEDRARGLDRSGKPLSLQPVEAGGIRASGGALILDNLNNNRYGSTMGDGSFGEVEVSSASLNAARVAIQACIDSFTWTGFPRRVP